MEAEVSLARQDHPIENYPRHWQDAGLTIVDAAVRLEGGGNDNCVEVAFAEEAAAVRDSKNAGAAAS